MTVESVMDGMPLQEAGIQQGDVITSINGVKITMQQITRNIFRRIR